MPRSKEYWQQEIKERIIKGRLFALRKSSQLVAFGSPQEPEDAGSTTLAGSTAAAHNGTIEHIEGAWVELSVTALDTAVTCRHNLFRDVEGYTVPVSGKPNVRWLIFGYQHDGNGASGVSTVSCNFDTDDNVNTNDIQLRFYAAGRTVGGSNPLKVTLFFTRGDR